MSFDSRTEHADVVHNDTGASENHASNKSTLTFIIILALIVIPVRVFVAKPFIVSGESMYPSFDTFHYLIIDQLTYRFAEPQRGDVIVFRYPQDTTRFFIKRIIGLPGETVILDNYDTIIENDEYPDGFTLPEPYVLSDHQLSSHMRVTLESDEYFVMGDNRAASSDSRYWGALEKQHISGRAFVRLFPFTQIGVSPAQYTYE